MRPALQRGGLLPILACSTAVVTGGCSDDSTEPAPDAGADASTAIFVSGDGTDSNPGTAEAPLRSITFALQRATEGTTIHVGPGVYDESSGESFPISVADLLIVGDEASHGADRQIRGELEEPLIQLNNAELRGVSVEITNASGAGAISFAGPGVLSGSAVNGIAVTNSGDIEIRDNRLVNGASGLAIGGAADQVLVTNNEITGNSVGVDVGAVSIVIGPGNTLSCNQEADMLAAGNAVVTADNNRWDHVPPQEGLFGNGIDIALLSSTASAESAELAAAPCP